ncbi:MAG: hypothetical protein KDJ14_00205 [Xanthomonadales bacterium]|nr:hypothetical protein [Xanthomonadales bacterium]
MLTLPGRGFCARMGVGINASAGLDVFTAVDPDELLRLALGWNGRREVLAGPSRRPAPAPNRDQPVRRRALRPGLRRRALLTAAARDR